MKSVLGDPCDLNCNLMVNGVNGFLVNGDVKWRISLNPMCVDYIDRLELIVHAAINTNKKG